MLVSEIATKVSEVEGSRTILKGRLLSDGVAYWLGTDEDGDTSLQVCIASETVEMALRRRLPRIVGGPFICNCDVVAEGVVRAKAGGRCAFTLDEIAWLIAKHPRGIEYQFRWDGKDPAPFPRLSVDSLFTSAAQWDGQSVAVEGTLRSTDDANELMQGEPWSSQRAALATLKENEYCELVRFYIPSDDQQHWPVCYYNAVVIGHVRADTNGSCIAIDPVEEVDINLDDVYVRFGNSATYPPRH